MTSEARRLRTALEEAKATLSEARGLTSDEPKHLIETMPVCEFCGAPDHDPESVCEVCEGYGRDHEAEVEDAS